MEKLKTVHHIYENTLRQQTQDRDWKRNFNKVRKKMKNCKGTITKKQIYKN